MAAFDCVSETWPLEARQLLNDVSHLGRSIRHSEVSEPVGLDPQQTECRRSTLVLPKSEHHDRYRVHRNNLLAARCGSDGNLPPVTSSVLIFERGQLRKVCEAASAVPIAEQMPGGFVVAVAYSYKRAQVSVEGTIATVIAQLVWSGLWRRKKGFRMVGAGGGEAIDAASVAAIASGILHVTGYLLYIRGSLSNDINPNPVTWLMFAYGTTLLTFLEYENDASWRELVLPIACTAGALLVAGICAARGRMRMPETGIELSAFVADVALTIGYAAFWWASHGDLITDPALKLLSPIGFLVCSNATTFTAFVPILASTSARPSEERATPWIVWTLAYTALFVATLPSVHGYENSVLLIYPVMNLTLHGAVALLALSGVWAAAARAKADFAVADTPRYGKGLFARRPFVRGELVFTMTGKRRYFEAKTQEEAHRFENWVGIGENTHMDPGYPFYFVNHSCSPNMGIRNELDFIALKDIAPGEELTFDYSVATAERPWAMHCHCDAPLCRGLIRSIHFLPQEVFERYLPFINPYFQKVYKEEKGQALR